MPPHPTLSPVKDEIHATRTERVHTKSTKQQMMVSTATAGSSRKREAAPAAEASPTKKSSLGPLVVNSAVTVAGINSSSSTSSSSSSSSSSGASSGGKGSAGRGNPFQEPFLMSPKGRAVVINNANNNNHAGRPKTTQVSYLPEGLWLAKERYSSSKTGSSHDEKKFFYMSTSYVPLGISIDVGNAFTKEIEIGCSGVAKVRVLFKGEEKETSTGPRITVKDVDVDQFDAADADENASFSNTGGRSGSAMMQKLVLRLPYPCRTVEVMVLHRASEFVSVFYVQCYSSSIRSSAQSTPVSKSLDRGSRMLM